MILVWLILILLGSGLLAWLLGRWSSLWPRIICLLAMLAQLGIIIALWIDYSPGASGQEWITSYSHAWIPSFGIQIKLAVDGLGLLMILLNAFLGLIAVLASWKEIDKRVGFYHFNLMLVLAGVTGVFLSFDLFLFYFSWELMLIPMFFLISIWGHENKRYAAIKFFLFTQASGMLMFLAIMGLYFVHAQNTGVYTFDYEQLLGTVFTPQMGFFLMLGFVIAFIVKMAIVPLHSWLPDAYTQAPTAGSIILAGSLLNAGAYGLIRFVLPLFPQASHQFAIVAMILGVVSILYGAKLAFAQTDLKRLIAYISVSHVGFILLGVFAFSEIALQGVVMQIIAHAICIGALFIIAGGLQNRIQTRELGQMGGLWTTMPKMGVLGLIFVMASLGLPGLGNFVGEILILMGSFPASKALTIIAAVGLIMSVVYSLRVMQKVFYGKEYEPRKIPDVKIREMLMMFPMAVLIILLGIYPMSVLHVSKDSVQKIIERVSSPNNSEGETVKMSIKELPDNFILPSFEKEESINSVLPNSEVAKAEKDNLDVMEVKTINRKKLRSNNQVSKRE